MINLGKHNLILASGSPRRKELLSSLRIPFAIIPSTKEETYPDSLKNHKVPEFLAGLKAHDVYKQQNKSCVVIGADTVVVFNDNILGKPKGPEEAKKNVKGAFSQCP